MRPRPIILSLMALIAYFAVAAFAMRSNDLIWSAVVMTLTVGGLCVATLLAFRQRGALAGFAVFGWAQFLVLQPSSAPSNGPLSLSMVVACRLAIWTSQPDQVPSLRIPDYPAVVTVIGDGKPFLANLGAGGPNYVDQLPVYSLRTVLCLWSTIVALLGAIASRFLSW